jgi:hypothetical protein
MKEFKIYTYGLDELEEKLNKFFETHPKIDLLTISCSKCLADEEFVKGMLKTEAEVSVLYL